VVTTTAKRGENPAQARSFGLPDFRVVEVLPRREFMLGAASLTLAACSGANISGPGGPVATGPAPTAPAAPGSTIGTGSVKIALLLPLSAGGAAGNTAAVLRNAAEMAVAEFQGPDITILVKDDGGSAAGAQAAAQAAISEGAEMILGPLLAESVRGAAAVARPAGKPIIAYSTDTSVATRGVYLMSFTPQNTVDRVVQYAAQQGKRSYAAFVPNSAFGQVVQGAFQEAVSRSGGRVVAIETFPLEANGVTAAASRLSGIAGQIDAIFVPDPYDGTAVRALSSAGIDTRRVQVLGVGPWVGNRAAAQAAPPCGIGHGRCHHLLQRDGRDLATAFIFQRDLVALRQVLFHRLCQKCLLHKLIQDPLEQDVIGQRLILRRQRGAHGDHLPQRHRGTVHIGHNGFGRGVGSEGRGGEGHRQRKRPKDRCYFRHITVS